MGRGQTAVLPSTIISSRDVEGVAVYDGQGKKIGTVDHLVIEKASGRILSVVVGGSGFIGLGHSHFSVSWDALHYSTKRGAFETQATPEPS